MKKVLLVLLLVTILIGLMYLISFQNHQNNSFSNLSNSDPKLIFQRVESWGPCPPGTECYQKTVLYNDNTLILTGNQTSQSTLEAETIQNYKNALEATNIMEIACPESRIVDYSAEYTFYHNGNTREIRYPSCQEELKKLEEALGI